MSQTTTAKGNIPIFQRFIEANEALLNCFDQFERSDLDSMNKGQLDSKCQSEKQAIKSILESN